MSGALSTHGASAFCKPNARGCSQDRNHHPSPFHLPVWPSSIQQHPQALPRAGGTQPSMDHTKILGEEHGTGRKTSSHGAARPRLPGCGRLWGRHAAAALTEDSEAAKNLGVVFNGQGDRRIGRSTDLWEKQPCHGRHVERGRAADPALESRPALGTGTAGVWDEQRWLREHPTAREHRAELSAC